MQEFRTLKCVIHAYLITVRADVTKVSHNVEKGLVCQVSSLLKKSETSEKDFCSLETTNIVRFKYLSTARTESLAKRL